MRRCVDEKQVYYHPYPPLDLSLETFMVCADETAPEFFERAPKLVDGNGIEQDDICLGYLARVVITGMPRHGA